MVHMRAWLTLLAATAAGCTREYYVRSADQEVYGALAERNVGPWAVPPPDIQPPPESRIAFPGPEVAPPQPPDDPFAHSYMEESDGIRGYAHWGKYGYVNTWENPDWLQSLPRDKDGLLVLNTDRAVLLGQVHSPFYRGELEGLYLNALALTLNRFEFTCQWYLLNSTFYRHAGTSSVPTESNTLSTATNFGFTRTFAAGGQLLVDFANSFVFEYTGRDSFSVNSTLSATLLQPLLRGGGRDVRMEALTQGERSLLYAIRDFARFRKQYYFNFAGRDGGYLGLLLLLQNQRNQEENVRRLEQIYQLHIFLLRGGSVSSVQVDQIYLSLKQAQAGLIQTRTAFENALDSYKFLIGLPPALPVKLDDSPLDQFALTTPEMDSLQVELNALDLKLRQPDHPPPLTELRAAAQDLVKLNRRTEEEARAVASGVRASLASSPTQPGDADEQQYRAHLLGISNRVDELLADLAKVQAALALLSGELTDQERARGWERLQRRVRESITLHADLLVYQTQVRVYALRLTPLNVTEEQAVRYAMENRLDLMNEAARAVDSWRKVHVSANALEPGLTLVTNANIATEPGATNPFDFSALASSYRVGVQFEGPLNRQIERNNFRASIIQYTRSRRSYLIRCDQVVQSLRRDLRQLEADRLNFEIARQSLIAAARQLEASRGRLLIGGDLNPATGTLDTLNALSALLQAKNTLIANWVNYETGRLQLLIDMEALQVDEKGIYRDHREEFLAGQRAGIAKPCD
jgi:outer membrane protein TolC